MPYINVRILTGATTAQKRAVVRDLTRSLVKRLGKSPEHIHIVIDEVAPENWGYAGSLTSELASLKPARRQSSLRKASALPSRRAPALLRKD